MLWDPGRAVQGPSPIAGTGMGELWMEGPVVAGFWGREVIGVESEMRHPLRRMKNHLDQRELNFDNRIRGYGLARWTK